MSILRVSEVFNNSRLMLIAVESIDFQRNRTTSGCRVYGSIEPVAVIVCGPDASYALDMEAKPAAIDQLRHDVPGLGATIAAFNKA